MKPRPAGRNRSKVALVEDHADRTSALAQRQLAEASREKLVIMRHQNELMERELALKAKHVEAKFQAQELTLLSTRADGLTEIGEQIPKMKQKALLEQMQRDAARSVAARDAAHES